MIFKKLKRIIEEDDTTLGRAFNWLIQTLIIISLVSFSVETLPGLTNTARLFLGYIEVITVVIFTVEYFLRILVANRKLGYIFSFFGIIDLLAILPFYITSSVDLRFIRALRLLRSIRLFKLVRYNRAIQRFHHALIISKEEITLFFFVAGILLYVSAIGIYHFEHEAQPDVFSSHFHSLWWAVATLTTVGYGDVYPVTTGGRLFTFFVLIVGLGIIAVPSGLVASALSEARRIEAENPIVEKNETETD
jgi:voltage-gated potassium channel